MIVNCISLSLHGIRYVFVLLSYWALQLTPFFSWFLQVFLTMCWRSTLMPSALISVSGDGIERCTSAAQLYFCYFEKPCWQMFYTYILLSREPKFVFI